jgi:RNase P/RNase MRP subunit p29
MPNKQTYQISDLGCAGAVISAGANLLSLDRTDYKKVIFVFEYSFELETMINDYWGKKLQVDARTFFENAAALKTRIFNER